MSAAYLGTFAGSILGGQIAGTLGIRYVFFVTSALLLINAVWVYFNVYKKLNSNYQFHDKNNQTKLGTINKQFQH
jgi:predicted MFS family arabinose efflux permease